MKTRRHITIFWLISSALLFLLVVVSAVQDPENVRSSISWLAPAICPGIGVIIGLWMSSEKITVAVANTDTAKPAKAMAGKLAFGLCIFYFATLLFSYLAHPLVAMKMSQWLELSQLWIALVQAPTLAMLSYVFKT